MTTSGDCSHCNNTFSRDTACEHLKDALQGNKQWAERHLAQDPEYFSKLANIQNPEWLWIGCSDSRVPANELLGMGPGEVFVQRNVGNLAAHQDMNVMSCLEYGITALKVKHVIVCGHYNCGAVKAALELPCKAQGLVNLWIQDIRDVRDNNVDMLLNIPKGLDRVNKLVELNVMRQVFNVCTSPVVQQAWDEGQPLAVHGLVYSVENGLLKELTNPITCLDDFEHYVNEELGDASHQVSKSMMTHLAFEREVLKRVSMSRNNLTTMGTDPQK